MADGSGTGARSGGRLFVEALLREGVTRVFCVPGESYLPVLDALHDVRDRIGVVTCRHEGGAGYMAEAHGKLTGAPGVCLVTRGPGATNAAIAIHVAQQDSTPLVLGIGQVPAAHAGREAFQEVDYVRMFGPLAKHVEQVGRAADIPDAVARAFTLATSGRPGPVVLALPEDALRERAAPAAPAARRERLPPPSAEVVERVRARLAAAQRPLLLVGGSRWDDAACARLVTWAEAAGLPVCAAFRRQDVYDNTRPGYVGYLGLNAHASLWRRVVESDCLLVLGARLDQTTTRNYTLLADDGWRERLVHVYPAAPPAGAPPAAERVLAEPAQVVDALATRSLPPSPGRAAWRAQLRAEYEESLMPPASGRALDLGRAVAALDAAIGDEAIVTLDAGNFTAWPQRFRRYRRPGRLLAPVNGAMGYGVPAAVAAALAAPGRRVVAFVGDGGCMMTGAELATAVQHDARPLIVVVDNGSYGTIRLHQERAFPGRPIATDLRNPDFAALARACGAHGETVVRDDELPGAITRALAADTAAVLHLRFDPDVLLPGVTLADLAPARGPA